MLHGFPFLSKSHRGVSTAHSTSPPTLPSMPSWAAVCEEWMRWGLGWDVSAVRMVVCGVGGDCHLSCSGLPFTRTGGWHRAEGLFLRDLGLKG